MVLLYKRIPTLATVNRSYCQIGWITNTYISLNNMQPGSKFAKNFQTDKKRDIKTVNTTATCL